MNIYAKVIKDSFNKYSRVTTLQISLPKVLLAEFNTHRVFSRNFSSSRAIPTARNKNLDLFTPREFLKNKAGMQAMPERVDDHDMAQKVWDEAIEYCRNVSQTLANLGVHKQWANRPMDWCVMATGVVTATEWQNFFNLRDHPDAQPEMQELTHAMKEAIRGSQPQWLAPGQWHLPYIMEEEYHDLCDRGFRDSDIAKFSAARVCRVSYNTLDNKKPTIEDDTNTYRKLVNSDPPHMSPLEAPCLSKDDISLLDSNIKGWRTLRQIVEASRNTD